jgi:hypothetical protein
MNEIVGIMSYEFSRDDTKQCRFCAHLGEERKPFWVCNKLGTTVDIIGVCANYEAKRGAENG